MVTQGFSCWKRGRPYYLVLCVVLVTIPVDLFHEGAFFPWKCCSPDLPIRHVVFWNCKWRDHRLFSVLSLVCALVCQYLQIDPLITLELIPEGLNGSFGTCYWSLKTCIFCIPIDSTKLIFFLNSRSHFLNQIRTMRSFFHLLTGSLFTQVSWWFQWLLYAATTVILFDLFIKSY